MSYKEIMDWTKNKEEEDWTRNKETLDWTTKRDWTDTQKNWLRNERKSKRLETEPQIYREMNWDCGMNDKNETVDWNRKKDKVDLTRKNVWTEIQRNCELNHKQRLWNETQAMRLCIEPQKVDCRLNKNKETVNGNTNKRVKTEPQRDCWLNHEQRERVLHLKQREMWTELQSDCDLKYKQFNWGLNHKDCRPKQKKNKKTNRLWNEQQGTVLNYKIRYYELKHKSEIVNLSRRQRHCGMN